MITGRQIREARTLLDWPPSKPADRAKVEASIVRRAEVGDGEPSITVAQASKIQNALEAAGVELLGESQGQPSVRLRNVRED